MSLSRLDIAFFPKHLDNSVASTRLRALVPLAGLQAMGVKAGIFDPAAPAPAVVVLGKRYGDEDLDLVDKLQAAGTRVVLDLCDNMLFNPTNDPAVNRAGVKLLRMLNKVDRVTCSTSTLAAQMQAAAGLQETPSVVDDPYEPARHSVRPAGNGRPLLLWFGRDGARNVPNGIRDLSLIAPYLCAWHARVPFDLVVCSDKQDTYEKAIRPLDLSSRFVQWTLDGFDDVLASADAVLLPFMMNDFVLPKTHNRLSLALGAGVPVLATAIPSYREFEAFCYLDRWDDGLSAVLTRPNDARAKAAPALAWIEHRFSREANARQWRAALDFN